MYDILISGLFGLVQGLTEFLPISSSGHLLLLHEIFDLTTNSLSFDAALHLGTLFAVVLYFFKDIRTIIIAFFRSCTKKRKKDTYERLAWYLIIGSIPAVIIGLAFESIIETAFRSNGVVITTLVIGGVLFFAVEAFGKKLHAVKDLTWKQALGIGIAQAFALIPGVSRSGITITTGMALNMTRYEAARFSFLLSIPVVFGAALKKMYDAVSLGIDNTTIFIVGIISAFVFGVVAIRFLLSFTQKHSLNGFGIYRIGLALVVLLVIVIF